ncbi:MAG: sulfatase-like hydrolase/transferase [Bryobacteraceae bacterium]|nr:sulfatase-like hydrolase/transferase [Bryobacteraceae bacterium]
MATPAVFDFRRHPAALYIACMRLSGVALILALAAGAASDSKAPPRPNILWLTSEDNGPHLGAYGDSYARTPNLDKLAARGMIYANAWSNAPVCAPARTAIISGMYPTSTGAEHMRSETSLPAGMKMFPAYLREAGYYCSNNSKEDYNLIKTGTVWDDSSGKAHWRNRKPDQPFFAVFNFVGTHESQIRKRPHQAAHDPAKVGIPAYHPDTPETRQDWAQYHDKMTEMDAEAGEILRQLEEDGLQENTIVFYYGDHGPGMPRSKRWPYNSGLHVPLIVYAPERYRSLVGADWQAGGRTGRLVGFVDLAPTVLSLAGIEPPAHMQGKAFLGPRAQPEATYVFGFRGRMDERYDLVRSARDKRYVYIRNYMPHKIYGQYVSYMFETPTTRAWKRLYDEGKLKPPQTLFWETKPPEELYDLESDPDEVKNLAESPESLEIVQRFRQALLGWAMATRDIGLQPEGEIHSRSRGSTPYEVGHDSRRYPLERVLGAAQLASSLKPDATVQLKTMLGDSDSAIRYWGAMGILMRGAAIAPETREEMERALSDASPYVRIVAAETLGRYHDAAEKVIPALVELANAEKHGVYASIAALNALEALGGKAKSALPAIKALPLKDAAAPERAQGYIQRLVEKIVADLE